MILSILQYAVTTIVVLSVIVVVHEFGHFIVAKKSGIKVHEFSLGMGPKIWGIQRGETLYAIRALPLGGFIRPEGEDTVSDDPRAFGNKSVWARIAVVAAGPIFNFILTFAIIVLLLTFAGRPVVTVGQLLPDKPAIASGLQTGDKILKINNHNIYVFEELISAVNEAKGAPITVSVLRGNTPINYTIVPQFVPSENRYLIGLVSGTSPTIVKSTLSQNFAWSLDYSKSLIRQVGYGLKRILMGKITKNEVGGPVRIVAIAGETAKAGVYYVIHLIALLSLSLGIFNLFPLPALDGGRLVFLFIEAVRGRPIDIKKEAMVHFVGFVLLLTFVLFITFNDIQFLRNVQ